MKRSLVFAFLLLIFCTNYKTYTCADVYQSIPPAQGGIFSLEDTELYELYRGTLVGHQHIDDKIIDLIHKVRCSPAEATTDEMQAIRDFYFSKFFEYMDGLKDTKKDPTDEFLSLWDSIYVETKEISEVDIRFFNWRIIKTIFIRGLLLASGEMIEDIEAVEDVLSKIPGTQFFFAAIEPVRSSIDTMIPAWKHSSAACVANLAKPKIKGANMPKLQFDPHFIDAEKVAFVKQIAMESGLRESIFVPIHNLGSLGITTILKMWLNHVYPVPLTYGKYHAHGLELGPVIGAIHDLAHGHVDNRRISVLQAILNLLKSVPAEKINNAAIKMATNHMVKRYLALNEIFKGFVAYKEATLLEELKNIARLEISDPSKSAKIKTAKQKYNCGIAALFYALHEKYAVTPKVLGKDTFAEAIEQFYANTTKRRESTFVDLETLFNPKSDLSNEQIITAIKSIPLSQIGVSFDGAETIGEHPHLGIESATVTRKNVHTEIVFSDKSTEKTIILTIPTARYEFATYDDENTLLKLVGNEVPKPEIDLEAMQLLPVGHAQREAAKQQAIAWITAIDTEIATMMGDWVADLTQSTIVSEIDKYDSLVAEQNAEWKRLFQTSGLRRIAHFHNLVQNFCCI